MKKYSFFRALFTILFFAVLTGTVLVTFSPGAEYIDQFVYPAQNAVTNNETANQGGVRKIVGIIPGHYGFDSGYQCGADFNFVRETDVNLRIAVMVRDYLENQGYTVDFMHEFDPALSNYTGLALVSIHSNRCDAGSDKTGFNITTGGQNTYPSESKRLNDCLTYHYAQNSGLDYLGENYSPGEEMLYSFDTVNSYTTISIVHTGYLSTDYRTISENTASLAKGIADGIICYVENDSVGSLYQARPVDLNTLSSISSSGQNIFQIPVSEAIASSN